MHFQLLESDVLLELLELLLLELSRAANFFVVTYYMISSYLLLYCVYCVISILVRRDVAHSLGTLGPACAALALRCGNA